MKQSILKVISNTALNSTTMEMVLEGDFESMKAGQFVEVAVEGHYLRRPFSVAYCTDTTITLLYKIVGKGTEDMSRAICGKTYDVLSGLGNTFDTSLSRRPLLVGGGIGVAPLFILAKEFSDRNIRPTVVLGFRNSAELFYADEFRKYADVIITTDDGSAGLQGNVIDAIKCSNINYDYYYACGPMVMLRALIAYDKRGQLSLEARMGCGFGACMGCSVQTTNGYKRVCKEGPVFEAEELLC